MGAPRRVWAISAVHGQHERLTRLHDALLDRIQPGDRIIYLGNYTGYNRDSSLSVDELLTFRRLVLSQPGMMCSDLVYLRGRQEEMWQKLLQLQFAPNPTDVLLWMLGHGLSDTLYSYGLCPHDGIEACRSGVMMITRWTNKIRQAVKDRAGHDVFNVNLQRAAFTDEDTLYPMLFVHSGLDDQKPLDEQGDDLWWAGKKFSSITMPYDPFQKVVRGYDPDHKGLHLNCVTATIDGGCGFGGSLVSVGFDTDGSVLEILET